MRELVVGIAVSVAALAATTAVASTATAAGTATEQPASSTQVAKTHHSGKALWTFTEQAHQGPPQVPNLLPASLQPLVWNYWGDGWWGSPVNGKWTATWGPAEWY